MNLGHAVQYRMTHVFQETRINVQIYKVLKIEARNLHCCGIVALLPPPAAVAAVAVIPSGLYADEICHS